MAASDHLGVQWYHGSATPLRPGDHVEPGHPGNYPHTADTEHQRVYATESMAEASMHATNAAKRSGGQARVYQVQPTGPIERDSEVDESYAHWFPSVQSNHPMRVLGEVPGDVHRAEHARVNAMTDDNTGWPRWRP